MVVVDLMFIKWARSEKQEWVGEIDFDWAIIKNHVLFCDGIFG